MPHDKPATVQLPPIKLDHLKRLTDDTGLIQHAFSTAPNPLYGYSIDDVARGLVVLLRFCGAAGDETELALAWRYLGFIKYAQRRDGWFHNLLAYDRNWHDDVGSRDCQGRTMRALGYALNYPNANLRRAAELLLESSLPNAARLDSPRARAFALIGLDWAYHAGYESEQVRAITQQLAEGLMALWQTNADSQWAWFENSITYASGKLCEGLFHAHRVTGEQRYLEVGLQAFDFLLGVCFVGDMLDVVGESGWYTRGGKRAHFDQQPIDAQAMVEACLAAHRLTGEERYLKRAKDAFAWFLGRNRRGQAVYDETSGGCRDGLTPQGANTNQGAESCVAYLLARLSFEVPIMPDAL